MPTTGQRSRHASEDSGSATVARSINAQFRSRASADADVECAFLCECGRFDCQSPTVMTLGEHAEISSRVGWFAILPGHERPADKVVRVHARYLVVTRSG